MGSITRSEGRGLRWDKGGIDIALLNLFHYSH